MLRGQLIRQIGRYAGGEIDINELLTAVDAYSSASNNGKPIVSGWVSVHDALPETLETVWVSNGKGWTTLGCRTNLYDDGEGGRAWCWAAIANGIIYEEDGKIVAECEEDDLDVCFWHRLPVPPCR